MSRGDRAGALKDSTTAIELNPDFAEAYTLRGYLRATQGDFDAAVADCSGELGESARKLDNVRRGIDVDFTRFSKELLEMRASL